MANTRMILLQEEHFKWFEINGLHLVWNGLRRNFRQTVSSLWTVQMNRHQFVVQRPKVQLPFGSRNMS